MTEQVTEHSLAAMFLAPEPENTESTGEAEETEVLESQTVESTESDLDDYEPDTDGSLEGDDETDDSEEPERYTVKVDGEELEVTLEEMAAGYQRDSDYRKKTMTLAEERKAAEAKVAEIDSTLAELQSFIKREEDSTDWEALRRDDPAQYLEKREALDKAKESEAKATELKTKEMQAQYDKTVKDETAKLLDYMGPTWTGEQRNADIGMVNEYLTEVGYSDQEIASMVDSRAWRVFLDAAKGKQFSNTKQKVSKEVRKAPKSVKPGQKVPASQRKKANAYKAVANADKHSADKALANLFKQFD
jgi:hypothetical protein